MKRLTKEQVLFLHKDLMEMVLGVASGQISFEEMVQWIIEHQEK